MQKKQVFNPFLPLNEYIPDGEPHVFNDRVYHYGSHDKEAGYTFCMRDYVVYSAPVDDLSDWRYEGVSYKASQDPVYPKLKYMYAPDVVRGNDGKYYLYYCMGGDYGYGGYTGHISVAVSDSPAGPFDYLGFVRNPDGSEMKKYICFDPAVINDNGVIRLYYGTWYGYEEEDDFLTNDKYINEEIEMFGRTKEEILSYEDSINGANIVVLEDDMLTVKEEAKHIIPYKVKGTSFEEHPFFEGASMRKVKDKYYFVYSSWLNHELCYATSDYPDRDFTFGGTIVSNGDVGFKGRESKDRLNMTGTTHGSIVEINGQWYVFYHRLTHKSDYSRQACAEEIFIEADGSIKQVEITSQGLNDGPLKGSGNYPAVICCNLTNGHMPHGSNSVYKIHFPNVTNKGDERFIAEIEDNTLIGYKYFEFDNLTAIKAKLRVENEENKVVFDIPLRVDVRSFEDGSLKEDDLSKDDNEDYLIDSDAYFDIFIDIDDKPVGRMNIDLTKAPVWTEFRANISVKDGVYPLYLVYHGKSTIQLIEIGFE
ncbi:MAG: family 43 glycosylhydrolase [Lachnospiraceae bacterium]|nr:family 43 glycosylhydrolase [Lachnospiraceae bacterium]